MRRLENRCTARYRGSTLPSPHSIFFQVFGFNITGITSGNIFYFIIIIALIIVALLGLENNMCIFSVSNVFNISIKNLPLNPIQYPDQHIHIS